MRVTLVRWPSLDKPLSEIGMRMLSFAKQIDIYPIFPTDHSMGSKNFLRYIRSKITDKQCSLLSISASNNFQIECHGVFFETLDEFLCLNAYTVVSDHWQVSFSYKKVANYKRPTWLMVENACKQKKLIIIVSPAKEYLQQYASIIQSVLLFLLPKGHGIDVYAKATAAAQLFKVFYYPEVSCNFSKTMGVSDFIADTWRENDIYILGEGDKVFADEGDIKVLSRSYHDFESFSVKDLYIFGSASRLRILSVKHSFWGSASGNVARNCAFHGRPKAILYIAKLGALSKKLHLFDMVSPNKFFLWANNTLKAIKAPPAFFNTRYLDGESVKVTRHVTLPTLVEETSFLLNYFDAKGFETIDNEISYMAKEISEVNSILRSNVAFSCLHIVTDNPSSSILEDLPDETNKLNHLLSKDSLCYRRKKQRVYGHFITLLMKVIKDD